ncbi:MAG: TonB-dependent receptor [Acidobacteria bacterium]|nr:TonB-dependent receptor [Acidobacteriota bacterium]
MLHRFATVLTFVCLCAGILNAQATTATFHGIVEDATGAVVPGATVTLTHEETNTALTKTSDETGAFEFNFLRVGKYMLRIEAQGFKRLEQTGIELTAAQNVRSRFPLELGAVTETVKVEGAGALVNTVSTEQLNTFDSAKVIELPLSRRNFSSLLRVGSGITSTGDSFRLNGVGKNGTGFSVDGTDASANPEGKYASTYGGANYIDIMSIEAIQEVHTIKGIVPAEYGNIVGGQVNLLSKSGTNEWHGTVFENFQAENLNARNQFLATKPGTTFNQFGGSAGGFIRRDKLFVFGVYEGYRERSFQLVQANVPTALLRSDMLRAVPEYRSLMDIVPLPNQPASTNPDIGLYLDAKSSARHDNHSVVKVDWGPHSAHHFAFSYKRGRPYRLLPRYYTNTANDRDWQIYEERGVASYIAVGSNWTSETRFGYSLSDANRIDRYFFSYRDPRNPVEEREFGRRAPRMQTTFGFGTDDIELYLIEGRSYNIDQKYARHAGCHSFRFGGSYMHHCCQRNNPEGTDIQYTSRADLVANIPSMVSPTFGNGNFVARMFEFGLFAQDDWRVNSKLVVNLGLRYDFFSNLAVHGKSDAPESGFYNPQSLTQDGRFIPGPIRPLDSPYDHDKGINLGPRVGFAYNIDGKGKTVIRGGFGAMFSNQVPGAMWQSTQYTLATPFRIRISRADSARFGLKWPSYNDEIRKILVDEQKKTGRVDVFSIFNTHLQNPYTMNTYFGIQRELTPTLMFETAFVSTQGRKFVQHRWANTVDRVTGLRPNSNLSVNYYVDHSQTMSYNSWQGSLRKRLSRNLSGSIHYTWGKGLSVGGGDVGAYYQGDNDSRTQDYFNLRADRGPNTGDITHYFSGEWIYELPRFRSMTPLVRHTLGGWQASGILVARTGEPVVIGQPSTIEASRPDYVGGQPILNDYRQTLVYLNRDAFRQVPVNAVSRATVRPGNVGNGAIRTPGAWTLDFSLAKNFTFAERWRIQFRTDMFNAFNHTNPGGLDTNITSVRFGRLTSAGGTRVIQLNARLSF